MSDLVGNPEDMFSCNAAHLYEGREMLQRVATDCMREKPAFWVCNQVRHKPDCKATENDWRLEILVSESIGIVLYI